MTSKYSFCPRKDLLYFNASAINYIAYSTAHILWARLQFFHSNWNCCTYALKSIKFNTMQARRKEILFGPAISAKPCEGGSGRMLPGKNFGNKTLSGTLRHFFLGFLRSFSSGKFSCSLLRK